MEKKLGHDWQIRVKERRTGGLFLASLNRVQTLPFRGQTEHGARVLCLILS